MSAERPLFETLEQNEFSQKSATLGPLANASDQSWDIGYGHRSRVIDEVLVRYTSGSTVAAAADFQLLRARSGRSVANVVTDALKVTLDGSLATAANRNAYYVVPHGEVPLALTSIEVTGTNLITVTTAAHGITTNAFCTLRLSGVTGDTAAQVNFINNVHNAKATAATTFSLLAPDGTALAGLTNETEVVSAARCSYVPSTLPTTFNPLYQAGQKVLQAPSDARTRLSLAPGVTWSLRPDYTLLPSSGAQGHNILEPGEGLVVNFSGTQTNVAGLYITVLYRLRRK